MFHSKSIYIFIYILTISSKNAPSAISPHHKQIIPCHIYDLLMFFLYSIIWFYKTTVNSFVTQIHTFFSSLFVEATSEPPRQVESLFWGVAPNPTARHGGRGASLFACPPLGERLGQFSLSSVALPTASVMPLDKHLV